MKSTAAVVASRGAALTIEEPDLGEPAPGEIAVRIAAAGICRTDLHIRDGGYPVPGFPVIPGHEGAGVVTAVGSAVAGLRPGDHVLLTYPFCGPPRPLPARATRSPAEIAALCSGSLHAVLGAADVAC